MYGFRVTLKGHSICLSLASSLPLWGESVTNPTDEVASWPPRRGVGRLTSVTMSLGDWSIIVALCVRVALQRA